MDELGRFDLHSVYCIGTKKEEGSVFTQLIDSDKSKLKN